MDLDTKTMVYRNWAVVGATNKKNKFGYKIFKKMEKMGYTVYPVNPNLEEIDGVKCYKKLSSINQKIDVVDLVVNPKIGIKVMEEIDKLGIRYVWLQPGTRSDEIREFADMHGIRLVEDCIYARL